MSPSSKSGREILAANIRIQAARRRVSLNRLADLAGVSRSQLYDVLATRKAASVDWVESIAAALEVDLFELFSGPRS